MSEDALFGIPADVMGQNPTPVDIPISTEAPTIDPAEEAAMKFTKLLPFVSKLANALPSKGGLVRVIHAMSEFPLGAEKPRLLNESERQLFHICQELNGYKSTVIQNILTKNAEAHKEAEALKQTAAELPVAESVETNG